MQRDECKHKKRGEHKHLMLVLVCHVSAKERGEYKHQPRSLGLQHKELLLQRRNVALHMHMHTLTHSVNAKAER